MDELEKQKAQAAIERAEQPGRPSDLGDPNQRSETLADDMGFERPERVEHTSEKEHPPGKE
jgi:hypothetical protein